MAAVVAVVAATVAVAVAEMVAVEVVMAVDGRHTGCLCRPSNLLWHVMRWCYNVVTMLFFRSVMICDAV